jgi:16S rRNA U1498 N3-methylase RsmE
MVVREGAGLDRLGLGGLVLLCDRDGGPMPAPGERVTIVVGPEGGLADDEAAPDWIRVSLGPTILRTETAAIVAAAMALAVGRAASRD